MAKMKLHRVLIAASFAVALAGVFGMTRSLAQTEELDPVRIAPDVNKVVFENALVRVSEERMPPGRVVTKHRHLHGVTVALADYQMEQKMYPNGNIVRSNRHFGEVNWTETIIHEARNVGTTNQDVVRIELK
jgi:hypothetical protein